MPEVGGGNGVNISTNPVDHTKQWRAVRAGMTDQGGLERRVRHRRTIHVDGGQSAGH
jgi:hypothetical protein